MPDFKFGPNGIKVNVNGRHFDDSSEDLELLFDPLGGLTAGPNGLTLSTVTPLSTWLKTQTRYYFISYLNGSDSNLGFIEAPTNTVFTPAQGRAVAFKTIEQFLSAVPKQGNGLRLVALLEGDPTASAPISYFDKDGTTLSTIELSGISGYSVFLIRASDFTNNAADQLRCATYVKQAGPGTGGRWTIQSWSAPKITVTSSTLSTTFGTLEGCCVEFDGNVTAALATKGGIVKHAESSSVLNVGIGSTATQTAGAPNDTFLITAPSVKTGPVQGGQSVLSTGASALGASGVVGRFPGPQVVGLELANPGTYTNSATYRLLANNLVLSKCFISGFSSGRFAAGSGFQFTGSYSNEAGALIETGHSFCWAGNTASSSLQFSGVANCVPNAASSVMANIAMYATAASSCVCTFDGIVGPSAQVNMALLTRSAIHGIFSLTGVILAPPATDQATVGGSNGVYDQLLVRPRVNTSDVIILNGNNKLRLGNIALGTGVDGITMQGVDSCVELLNIVNDSSSGVLSGYGLNMSESTRSQQSQVIDISGNTVTGTAGDVQLATGIVYTWASVTQGFQSAAGVNLNKRGQTIGAFQKITPGTVGNVPVLTADPTSPANGDVWITDISTVRNLCVRISGTTYRTLLT